MRICASIVMLLLLSSALRAVEEAQSMSPISNSKKELIWPEILDPKGLIDFAREKIGEFNKLNQRGGSTLKGDMIPGNLDPRVGHFGRAEFYVTSDTLSITILNRPFTGQAILVLPNQSRTVDIEKNVVRVEDTANPEIKRILLKIPEGANRRLSEDAKFTAHIKDFKLQAANVYTAPRPDKLVFPDWPDGMIGSTMPYRAELLLSVDETGAVTPLSVKKSWPEFEQAVRESAQRWHFEPGIDAATRLPIKTQVSLVVEFQEASN